MAFALIVVWFIASLWIAKSILHFRTSPDQGLLSMAIFLAPIFPILIFQIVVKITKKILFDLRWKRWERKNQSY